jgi:hypothetical protein
VRYNLMVAWIELPKRFLEGPRGRGDQPPRGLFILRPPLEKGCVFYVNSAAIALDWARSAGQCGPRKKTWTVVRSPGS